MTIEKARELLGEGYNEVSDEEIQKLIDMVKCLCSFAVEDYLKERELK